MGSGNALAYGLANGASGFAQMFTRAMEMADAHRRRMEELGLRRGPQLPPGVTGETDRDMRDENKSLGREFGAAAGAPKGVTPDVKYGTLPPDEAAVLLQKRVGAVPDARGGRSFNTGFADASGIATPQESQRFQMANAANNRQVMAGPAFGAPIAGPFDRAMHAFRDDPAIREQMFPSPRLDADIAASPFAQAMKDAGNRAALAQFKASGASPAKTVERAPQAERGDILARLATLEPAAQMEAASALGKHLGYFGQQARQQKMEDERSKAQMQANIGIAAASTKAKNKSEIEREAALEKAVTRASQTLKDSGKDVTPEAIAAAIPGITPEDAKRLIEKPRPITQASGESEQQKRRKSAENDLLRVKNAELALTRKLRRVDKGSLKRYAAALQSHHQALGMPSDEDAIAAELGQPFGLKEEEAARILMGK